MRFTFLVYLGFLHCVFAFEFKDAGTDGVHFDDKTPTAQPVTVNENNDETRLVIVLLTDVKIEPTINPVNNAVLLEATVEPTSNPGEYQILAKTLDYEKIGDKNMLIYVMEGNDGTTRQALSVIIKNLDDESPTLTTSSCAMNELTVYTVENSPCALQVSDPDGFLDKMDFTKIVGSRGESELFEFQYKETPTADVHDSDVYLVLKKGKVLDYDTAILYTFHVEAKDGVGHQTTPLQSVPIIVQVNDIPNKPPVWESFLSAQTIIEKQPWSTHVSARDGDYGINNHISYTVDDLSGYVSIDKDTGEISVEPINRDAGNDQISFSVTAIEVEDPTSTLTNTMLLIIQDVDDQIPEITVDGSDKKELNIAIDEGSTEIDTKILVSDIDQGENAIYTAKLTSTNEEFLSAFSITPGRGYENTTLTLTILDPKKLNYETPDWIKITMELHTYGTKNTSMTDSLPITINLNDINDEPPVFEDLEPVKIYENVTKGALIASVKATDEDAEDIAAGLKHKLLGTLANNILSIEDLGGDITTLKDDAFDYEKQNEVFIQISATDLGGHTATTQLTIQVLDVNDENPKLVVSSSIEVQENQKDGTELQTSITASDEDTTADLKFEIDWSKSYATKNSRRLTDDDFKNYQCINVETIAGSSNHEASARLTIIETQRNNTPDFEIYDNLYVYLIVRDNNTEKGDGYDSALVGITIGDENDNSPEFSKVAEQKIQVVENTASGDPVGTITATDKDVGDNITYYMNPVNDETPNWFIIDELTGQIHVQLEEGDKIDADTPENIFTYNVTYTVTASDSVHNTSIDITIDIKDQNDLIPALDDQKAEIEEDFGDKPTPDRPVVIQLKPTDGDRDEPFHTVKCSFATTTSVDVTSKFKIDDNNNINVIKDVNLDRETLSEFKFELACIDDPTQQGPVSNPVSPPPKITITLKDVNDNPPTITTKTITGLSENTKAGELDTKLEGKDDDVGDNSLMNFKIVSIERCLDSAMTDCDNTGLETLFDISTEDHKEATLTLTKESLKDLYGYLKLEINTTDLGDPPLSNVENSIVTIEVAKFNFEAPIFEIPTEGATFYLKTTQIKDSRLKLWNDDYLDNFKANDQQGGKYGISYSIIADSSDEKLFKITPEGQLQLKKDSFTAKPYTLTVQASIDADESHKQNDEKPYNTNCTFIIDFFDYGSTDPVFSDHEGTAAFSENSEVESFKVPEAKYPNVNISNLDIFYLIREGDRDIFELDSKEGNLTLKQPLDYEQKTSYDLIIQSSNKETINDKAINETKYYLTIKVVDVNDNLPVFDQKEYISILTSNTATVLKISATDLDSTSQGQLIYSITSIESHVPGHENAQDYFKIEDPSSGAITHHFSIPDGLDGYFTLYLSVHDEDESHTDNATAQVYLVTSKHTVNFKFENKLEVVQNETSAIKTVLEDQFQYNTTVETPKKDTSSDDDTERTIVPVFFLDTTSHKPQEATEILKQVTKVDKFQSLKEAFLKYGLLLMSFSSDSDTTENLEETLKAWLIGVSVVLGALCLILVIAFILKTRSLSQRIQKLSNTKFGSQESGLNRQGIAAPTTNKHAVEGSNPVYNNDVDTKEVDRRSVTSGDSDLIGVEDDEKFNYDDASKDEV